MRIESITLSNFRCFGPTPTHIDLGDATCFIGANGSGKSAVLQALLKLFGVRRVDRNINPADFHVPKGETINDADSRELFIEAKLSFPDLSEENGHAVGVPECFNQMTIEDVNGRPYCRIRLKATWEKSRTPDGEVHEEQFWITTGDEDFTGRTSALRPADRSLIHVYYIPAARDPAQQIRNSAGSILHRVFRAIEWTDQFKDDVEATALCLAEKFESEQGVKLMNDKLATTWHEFTDGEFFRDVKLNPIGSSFEDFVARIEALFQPSPDGLDVPVSRLSDGMRSLFYLTLIKTVFDVEQQVSTSTEEGISYQRLAVPTLTYLAIEEPENHLAPHYLARVIDTFKGMISSQRVQFAITSHSPSVLRRIAPEDVRFVRLSNLRETIVKPIILPADQTEAFTYVKQAIQAYPELYFSKAVVLGEGTSEEIVLPKVACALGLQLDPGFISVVPLGGRHVNHFWKLLHELEIPYVTLLDYDRFRTGGSWGRIKYVRDELQQIGISLDAGAGLSDIEQMLDQDDDDENLNEQMIWLQRLEENRVFFSGQLDLDYAMLKAFPSAYRQLTPTERGPRVPEPGDPNYDSLVKAAFAAVVKRDVSAINDLPQIGDASALFWYRYLFLNRSKPSTHLSAFLHLSDADIADGCPNVLRRMFNTVQSISPPVHPNNGETQ